MELLNKYLSRFQFNEVHTIHANANAEMCYDAALNLDLAKSKIIKLLFQLRGLPFKRSRLNEVTEDMRFTLLEENKYREFLYGFRLKNKIEWITDKNEFMENTSSYSMKAGWSFSFHEDEKGMTEIRTETRVYCFNLKTKIVFGMYWFLIRLFSGWIRIEMLKLIKKRAETAEN